jgi:GntR family transcriptional regulator
LFNIDKQSRKPVYEQLIDQIERLILIGVMQENGTIPSVRTLAVELSINPNTIQKAYNDLEIRGITYSVPGIGRFISKDAKKILSGISEERLNKLEEELYELALAGIPKEQILEIVEAAFEKAENLTEERIEDKND